MVIISDLEAFSFLCDNNVYSCEIWRLIEGFMSLLTSFRRAFDEKNIKYIYR
jgi:hypothetical protein